MDSVLVSPSGVVAGFCAGDGDPVQLNNWTSGALAVTTTANPGSHDIEIDAGLVVFTAGDRVRFDEIQVTVIVAP